MRVGGGGGNILIQLKSQKVSLNQNTSGYQCRFTKLLKNSKFVRLVWKVGGGIMVKRNHYFHASIVFFYFSLFYVAMQNIRVVVIGVAFLVSAAHCSFSVSFSV